MKNLKIFIILILIILSSTGLLKAVDTAAMRFLDIIPDARSEGRGESFVAVADSAAGMNYWNPGALGYAEGAGVSLTHSQYFADISYQYLSGYFSLGKMMNFGVSAMLMSSEGIATIFDDQSGLIKEPGGNDSAGQIAIGAVYGFQLLPYLGVGAGIKYVSESLKNYAGDGVSGSSFAFDVGALSKGLVEDMTFGLSIKDLAPKADYDGTKNGLSTKVLAGAAMDVWRSKSPSSGSFSLQKINVSADVHIMAASDPFINIGGEADSYIKNIMLQFRLGYRIIQDLGVFAGLNLGLGVGYKNLGVDYAFNSAGDLGAIHRITLNYKFGMGKTREAEKVEEGKTEEEKAVEEKKTEKKPAKINTKNKEGAEPIEGLDK